MPTNHEDFNRPRLERVLFCVYPPEYKFFFTSRWIVCYKIQKIDGGEENSFKYILLREKESIYIAGRRAHSIRVTVAIFLFVCKIFAR